MGNNGLIIRREWAMPDRHTFMIKPIRKIVMRYCGKGRNWIDPFAGENSPAEFTNDLNPKKPTMFHLHALDFIKQLQGHYDGILFDPPYSARQSKDLYESVGIKYSQKDAQDALFTDVKDVAAPKIKTGGIAICCGWSTTGFGIKRGFEFVEILLCCHGGNHNDTIITVERKFTHELF